MLRDIDINDKCSIQIEQIIEGEEGSVVWDSGLVLLDFFNKHKEFVNNKSSLEWILKVGLLTSWRNN